MSTGPNRIRFATLDSALLARKGEATPATAVAHWIEQSGATGAEEVERSVPVELAVLGRARAGHGLIEVALDRLRPSGNQPRRRTNEAGLEVLAQSIRTHGVLQPILVRPDPDDEESYRIIAGERRWRAAGIAGRRTVPVLVRRAEDDHAFEIALIENLQREDLDPLDEAAGYRRLLEEFERTQEEVARLVGRSRSHIANSLRLLGLPAEVKALVHDGQVSAGHARALLGAADPVAMAERVASERLSVRETENLARKAPVTPAGSNPAVSLADLEARFKVASGLAVAIKRDRSGACTLRFSSIADLEALVVRLERGGARWASAAPSLRADEFTPGAETL